MSSTDLNREVPFYPIRRSNTLSRFSTLIAIETTSRNSIACWTSDPISKNRMLQLLQLEPDREDREWLSHFLDILRNSNHSKEERERAKQHILCFYQETCFWTTKNLWRKVKFFYPPATWLEVFEQATKDFETIEGAIAALKNFDPHQSTKKYIQTMIERKIKHWLKKKIGPDSRIQFISLTEQMNNNKDNEATIAQVQEIQQKNIEAQVDREILNERKMKHDRVLNVVEGELYKIEQAFPTKNRQTIGRSPISLWSVLILSYGFNLMQSGTANLLTANNLKVDQATLSRHLQKLKITLFIKCISEFSGELKTVFEEEKKSKDTLPFEQLQSMQKLATENQKLLDDILDDFCQNWLLEKVLSPLKREIYYPFNESIIRILSDWLQSYFDLILELTCLSQGQRKKFDKVVDLWMQNFEL